MKPLKQWGKSEGSFCIMVMVLVAVMISLLNVWGHRSRLQNECDDLKSQIEAFKLDQEIKDERILWQEESLEALASTIRSQDATITELQRRIRLKDRDIETLEKELQRERRAGQQSSRQKTEENLYGWQTATASWYGPGLYGNHVAWSEGGILQPDTMNFAHRTMTFGTRVRFRYGGKEVVAVCTDRGPFVGGRTFDLGPGTAKALGFSGVSRVAWKIE